MISHDAIIKPEKGKHIPSLGPIAVMMSTQADLLFLCRLMNIRREVFSSLLMSRLYVGEGEYAGVSLIGPFIGAPYAVILLENLIARGVKKIILFGWCGSVSHKVAIGDIVVPRSAIIDEGTSKSYGKDENTISCPSENIVKSIGVTLKNKGIEFHEGNVCSTDAVYRETREKVKTFQQKSVKAVEMETSALFSVGEFCHVEVGAILVVSDELATLSWKPGFRTKRFKESRRAMCEVIKNLCKDI